MYDLLLQGKISIVPTCDGKEIKATDCIIKVAITRGNITWCSFADKELAHPKIKSAWQPLLPSPKGLSFNFSYLPYARVNKYSFLFQPQLFSSLQALCGGERSRHIWPVKYIWSWIIIVDNYLYDKWVGRRNIRPLSFSVFDGCHFFSKNMLWVLAIIEDYMMIEYVELLVRLCWISWIANAWWLRT